MNWQIPNRNPFDYCALIGKSLQKTPSPSGTTIVVIGIMKFW